MRKFLLGMLAIVAMVATSCQKETDLGVNAGETVSVSINVATPTRAYSDGKTATVLQYAVYDANGAELTDLTKSLVKENAETIDISERVDLQLVTGNTYSVIFWAAAPNAPYTVDFANKTMTVDYTNAVSNDETRDAFYYYHTFTVNGAMTLDAQLKRPFAQLNIGTADYTAATNAGYTPTQSAVVVKNIYSTLDLATGAVDNEIEANFGLANIKKDETFPVAGFEYLAMNYLLVSAEQETVEVEFTYTNDANDSKTRTVGSVPVQRNYRTNIYGNLLTSDVDINVVIKPEYEGSFGSEQNFAVVSTLEDLQTAINAATAANDLNVIVLAADIVGDVTVVQKPGVKIQINGANYKYNGSIKVHSNSYHYADAALSINNVNFETSAASVNVIEALENGSQRYSTNITVENCTFTATDAAVNTAVGVQIKSSKNAKVIGCTATNMHSLIQAQSCDETVVVKGCTINGKNGVAFKQVKAATVEGTTITALEYGIRFDGNTDNYGIVVKNNNITAAKPLIIRKMTGKNNTIKLEGTNTLMTTEDEYQIVITNGSDDVAYVKPTGTYTLTGADNFLVYPRDLGHEVDENGNYHISNVKGWLWMADQNDTFFRNKTIYLDNDIDFSGVDMRVTRMWTPEYSATFDGQNHTITNVWMASNYSSDNQALFDGLMSVKNLTVTNSHVYGMSQVGIIGANIFGTIENCHVKGCRSYGYVHHVGGIVGLHSWGEIKNCSIENTNIECFYYGAVGAIAGAMNEVSRKITGCSVKGCQLIKEGPEGVYPDWDPRFGIVVGYAYAPGTYVFDVVAENNTIKGVASEQMYGEVAAGSTVTINGVQQ